MQKGVPHNHGKAFIGVQQEAPSLYRQQWRSAGEGHPAQGESMSEKWAAMFVAGALLATCYLAPDSVPVSQDTLFTTAMVMYGAALICGAIDRR
jgi:hypothetical protein